MTDDELVELMRRMADAGEYRDYYYGRPDPADPPQPGRLPDGSIDLPALRQWRRQRKRPMLYTRGTPAYEHARDHDLIDPLPRLQPATVAAIAETERQLDVRLPPLLRRLYLEVGDGGFGPNAGIFGMGSTSGSDTLVNINLPLIEDTDPIALWPTGVLEILDWGCNIYTLIDCRTADGWIWEADFNRMETAARTSMTLATWLTSWADGTML
ncbi:MAG TPA: SMI1/KNR4 family protein, partial [Micromonosporaceae bacterium]